MTSLFFAILVLFIVIIVAMGSVNRQITEANRELREARDSAMVASEEKDQILNLQEQFKTLANSTSLDYDVEKRMFYVKDFVGKPIFNSEDDNIKPEYLDMVDKVGKDIKLILDTLNTNNSSFKYLLVIEGMAAIPHEELNTYNPDNVEIYKFSYRRALALYLRWKHLNFRASNTEIIIAGSGFNGINRDSNQDNNKRFVIQIIPKISKPLDR